MQWDDLRVGWGAGQAWTEPSRGRRDGATKMLLLHNPLCSQPTRLVYNSCPAVTQKINSVPLQFQHNLVWLARCAANAAASAQSTAHNAAKRRPTRCNFGA